MYASISALRGAGLTLASRRGGSMENWCIATTGSAMDLVSWMAAAYVLLLPSNYQLAVQKVERISFPGTTVQTLETTCVWKNEQGQSINFSWWNPMPAYPGGRLVAAREAARPWARAPASYVETSVFDGTPARVVVAFQKRPELKAYARIHVTDMSLESLEELLASSDVRELTSEQASTAGCTASRSH